MDGTQASQHHHLLAAPDAIDALRRMAESCADIDRYGARAWWRRLRVVAPDDLDGLRGLIAGYLMDGYRLEARPLLAELVRRLPNHPKAHLLAERGFGPQDRGAARRALTRALVLQPDLLDAMSQLAYHAFCDGDRETAIRLDRRLVRLLPGRAPIHLRLGQSLHEAGDDGAACVHLQRAVALDRGLPAAMRQMIQAHLSRSEVADAREIAAQLALAAPEAGEGARLLRRLDHLVAAIECEADAARARLAASLATPRVARGRRRISVTIPSLRPELLVGTLTALAFAARDAEIEAIVVSSFAVGAMPGIDVIWVPEPERRGSIAAHAQAYERATGDLLLILVDDRHPVPGALDVALEQLDASEARHGPCSVGLDPGFGLGRSFVGTSFGFYYPYFGLMTRRTIERIGAYFDPGLREHFGDADMALRIWAAGGRCELALAAPIARNPLAGALRRRRLRSHVMDADRARYDARWRPIFGRGWGPAMEDYHIDYDVGALSDGTIRNLRPPRRR